MAQLPRRAWLLRLAGSAIAAHLLVACRPAAETAPAPLSPTQTAAPPASMPAIPPPKEKQA